MKVVFIKENFHLFFKFQKNLDESCLYKRQLLRDFSKFQKNYMKVVFCKDNFHMFFQISKKFILKSCLQKMTYIYIYIFKF
jgi:hypothetical protein